jgi:hypothetical protein
MLVVTPSGDEGKPKCQNCISKGFECRYAAAFQILGKHNFTPEVKTGVKYSSVRVCFPAFHERISCFCRNQNLPEAVDMLQQVDFYANSHYFIGNQSISMSDNCCIFP